jgi:predicted nuclease of predicted toxin-antitoxin system
VRGFYLDEHISRAVVKGLQSRGILAIMAVDVGMTGRSDEEHLAYATQRELAMVTFDHPFAGRTANRTDFFALVCLSRAIQQATGDIIEVLTLFASLFDPTTDTGIVYYLP